MKQVWIPKVGAPEVLEVREAPDPVPGPGEVRVRVEAAGVNYADLMARLGLYPDAPPLPCVVGYEAAGTIEAVGEGVDASRVGQGVVVATKFGGYSDRLVVPAGQVILRPPGLDAATAAAIPVTGLTAWMLLEHMGRVRAGDRVLIHSAGGGVGLMALDLCLRREAIPIGTASPWKHEELRALGYAELYGYDDLGKMKDKVDLVLDPVGGASWRQGLELLRPGGQLLCFGVSSNSPGNRRSLFHVVRNMLSVPWLLFNPVSLMNNNRGVSGVNMGHMFGETDMLAGWLDELLKIWQEGRLRPRVHAEVPFSRAAEAHQILHDRKNLGKVVLVPD